MVAPPWATWKPTHSRPWSTGKGGDLRVADPGGCPWDELAPEEAFPEPILHARDSELKEFS
jgi:hypothetical protein